MADYQQCKESPVGFRETGDHYRRSSYALSDVLLCKRFHKILKLSILETEFGADSHDESFSYSVCYASKLVVLTPRRSLYFVLI